MLRFQRKHRGMLEMCSGKMIATCKKWETRVKKRT